MYVLPQDPFIYNYEVWSFPSNNFKLIKNKLAIGNESTTYLLLFYQSAGIYIHNQSE